MHRFYFFTCSYFRFVGLRRRGIELLGLLQRFSREFVSMLAKFVRASMICLAMGNCCGGVGVRCQIV
jgi:hypothetical protein